MADQGLVVAAGDEDLLVRSGKAKLVAHNGPLDGIDLPAVDQGTLGSPVKVAGQAGFQLPQGLLDQVAAFPVMSPDVPVTGLKKENAG